MLRKYYELKEPFIKEDESKKISEVINVNDFDVGLLHETIEPKNSLPPLLLKLSERYPEQLDYLGVSFGITEPLLKFWKKANFIPLYLRQTPNDITGEYSCIMLSDLNNNSKWLESYWNDFRRRIIILLSLSFRLDIF